MFPKGKPILRTPLLALWLGCTLWWGPGCQTELDLYAPPQEIWVVYGVLQLSDSSQYVRISKAFQIEGDALDFAGREDLTVGGLRLRLEGNDRSLEAQEVRDVERAPGLFPPAQTLYRFDTYGEDHLVSGVPYRLVVEADSLPGFQLHATTRIPQAPLIQRPSQGLVNDTIACLPVLRVEDSLRVIFRTHRPSAGVSGAFAHQIQIEMDYLESGQSRTARFGPTRTFSESQGCFSSNRSVLCYLLPEGVVLSALTSLLPPRADTYRYAGDMRCAPSPDLLPEPVRVQVTNLDTMLGKYLRANDPRFTNFNTVRIEFSNIEGTERAVGVWGSAATSYRAVVLSRCAEEALYLNGQRPRPGGCN